MRIPDAPRPGDPFLPEEFTEPCEDCGALAGEFCRPGSDCGYTAEDYRKDVAHQREATGQRGTSA
jgi:hypothetical protein